MGDVSRETLAEPDLALLAQVFAPDRLPVLRRYVELLATHGVTRGLIGPREAPRLWDRHLVNCGLLSPLVPDGARVVDLGSGAGLPGLVLALARPDLRVTLVEPMLRRTTFLTEACELLGVTNATVRRGRADEHAGDESFDVVTARALAPLPRLLSWALPLVAPGGALLAMKGSSAADEIRQASAELTRWQASAEILRLSVPGSSTTTVVRVVPGPQPALGWRPTTPAPRHTQRRTRS
jgi:16S rRNA (guanine527-N7)-methyltransferase